MSLDEIQEYLEVDSLKYLKIEDLRECVQKSNQFCYACFDGNYPIPKTEKIKTAVMEDTSYG
jgi:amidophosphoribosyltransferase